jgi:KaiC/GvpD/RAD55 family RecA-like ATPase
LRRSRTSLPEVESYEYELGVSLPELTLQSLIRTVKKIVEEEGIQRIAVDPITSMILRYHELPKRRRAILMFFDALINTACTSLVTSELRTSALDRGFAVEEFLSQGVILLHTLVHEGNVIKAIQIEKMRGIQHDTQLRPYQIGNNGIEVFPKDRVF